MLITEYSAEQSAKLAAKQETIEKLTKELDNYGIKYRQNSSTEVDVFGKLTVASPIYSVAATSNGGLTIVDHSVERMKTDRAPEGSRDLFQSDNRRYLSVNQNNTYQYASNYRDVGGHMVAKKHFVSGSIVIADSNHIKKDQKTGKYMYGIMSRNPETEMIELKTLKMIDNGHVQEINKSSAKKAEISWDSVVDRYESGETVTGQEAFDAIIEFIVDSFDDITVNAATKGGKPKYMITPAEELKTKILAEFGDNINLTDNIDTVSADNVEMPHIKFTPVNGVTFDVLVRRDGSKTTEFVVKNIDKTLLFINIRANIDKINDPAYSGTEVGVIRQSYDKASKSVISHIDDVIDLMKGYVTDVTEPKTNGKSLLDQAFENEARSKKISAKTAADTQARMLQRQRDAEKSARYFEMQDELDKRLAQQAADDREAIKAAKLKPQRVSKKDYDDAVNSLFGDEDAYNSFLDRINNL